MTVPQDQIYYFGMHGSAYYGFEDESGDYTSEDFKKEPEHFREAVIALSRITGSDGKPIGEYGSSGMFTLDEAIIALRDVAHRYYDKYEGWPYRVLAELADSGVVSR